MLTIRLTRKGKKNQPFFRVVVVDKRRSSKGGRAVEEVGYVDPLTKRRSLKKERILHWIKMGAQPSATIHNLLITEKIIEGKKIHVARVKKTATPAQGGPASTASATPTPAPQTNADLPTKVLPQQNLGGQTQTNAETKTVPPAETPASLVAETSVVEPTSENKPEPVKEEPKVEEPSFSAKTSADVKTLADKSEDKEKPVEKVPEIEKTEV